MQVRAGEGPPRATPPMADRQMQSCRIERLHHTMAKTLDGCIDGVSLQDFLQCFAELANTHAATLTELHTQMAQIIKLNVQAEFEKIVEELDLANKLNELGPCLRPRASSRSRPVGLPPSAPEL